MFCSVNSIDYLKVVLIFMLLILSLAGNAKKPASEICLYDYLNLSFYCLIKEKYILI